MPLKARALTGALKFMGKHDELNDKFDKGKLEHSIIADSLWSLVHFQGTNNALSSWMLLEAEIGYYDSDTVAVI